MNKVIEKKRKKEEIEKCVLCGEPTPYLITTPISERNYYIEGSGQLCGNCHRDIYKEVQ